MRQMNVNIFQLPRKLQGHYLISSYDKVLNKCVLILSQYEKNY
jgi:hypothetical protein